MKPVLARVLLVLAAVGLAWAVWRLLDLRFTTGDIYPQGSTFRADPLGGRAYFESLQRLPGPKVSRSLEPVHRLGNGADTTLFLLSSDPLDREWLSSRNAGELDDFLAQGGRLVITVNESTLSTMELGTNLWIGTPPPGATNVGGWPFGTSLAFHWRFAFTLVPSTNSTNVTIVTGTAAAAPELPRTLPWPASLRLAGLDTNWTALYADEHGPVLATRASGKGWIILSSSDHFHGNGALRTDRNPALLAWLPGPSSRIVFDETHLGTELNPGIMTLARRYRLHGLGAGLLLLAALFIWQQASSLVPRHDDEAAAGEAVTAQDSAAGFLNLLRRAVPVAELVPRCFDAWRHSVGRTRPDLAPRIAAMQDLVNLENARPPKARNPLEVYRRLTALLHRR